jgi:hypothetical protein
MDRTTSCATQGMVDDRRREIGQFIWDASGRVHSAARRMPNAVVACRLVGGSMEHAIPARSLIRIAFRPEPLRTGEVVTFVREDRLLAHRIVYRSHLRRGYIIARGDARILHDPPVRLADVLGRVDAVDVGTGWQPLGPQTCLPRRERGLAFVLLVATAFLVELRPALAHRFAHWLDATEQRNAWTRNLLY